MARSSCEALACLAGFREGTPDNDGVQNSLRAMLTPFICRQMRENKNNDLVLKLLNSNSEDPYLIWDNATRAELLEFVEYHRTSNTNSSELFGAEFRLSIYADELVVGDIFVRIYNEQPNFTLLIASSEDGMKQIAMCLEALANLLVANPGWFLLVVVVVVKF
ncbi:unnamed protein product [Anisakis simplex]|uniref:Uncharacterized protein n=1 Tax=Anisakis simplex TaxID=6269 RepID=A0A3P6SXJ8_ANISI|nr:unnamed protein product [Anisakis simplex]